MHRLSVWRDNRNRLQAARAAFRAVFNHDIQEVASPSRLPEIYVFLASNFPKHSAAVADLSAHLSPCARRRLAKDWTAYASDTNEVRQRYNTLTGSPETEDRRKLAVERLQKVASHGSET